MPPEGLSDDLATLNINVAYKNSWTELNKPKL